MSSLTTTPEIHGEPQLLTLLGFQCLVQIFHLSLDMNSEMPESFKSGGGDQRWGNRTEASKLLL